MALRTLNPHSCYVPVNLNAEESYLYAIQQWATFYWNLAYKLSKAVPDNGAQEIYDKAVETFRHNERIKREKDEAAATQETRQEG